ncbi:hypothetical protein [Tateyamaria sp. SN3-11]|uniref:hypothetical protein n=1 Tax=Tateyamaria sp. SN3-11 TaxID=3092147 RepID=UPI0039EB8D25
METRWYFHGVLDQPILPARKIFDTQTGIVVLEEHYENGQLHRIDGPAVVTRNQTTGVLINEDHYIRGEFIRTDDFIRKPEP